MTTGKRVAGGKPAKALINERRLFVLDTNVLMHDPTAIFRFQEHDVYLPMVVLEELDSNKKGLSEASRNVRQTSRFLDDLMRDATKDQIDAGLPLPTATSGHSSGKAGGNGGAPGSGKPGSSRPRCQTIYRVTVLTTPSCRKRSRFKPSTMTRE